MSHEPEDYTLEYMKAEGIPLTRANYITINWMGEFDPEDELPEELEAEIPTDELIGDKQNASNAE